MAKIKPGENRYVLCLNDREEWHIFPSNYNGEKCVIIDQNSICSEMLFKEKMDITNCLSHHKTREICADKGRSVCGTCVSHLYKTLSPEEEEYVKD